MDSLFRIDVLACTSNPQSVCYQALHQDYSETYVGEDAFIPDEKESGEIVVKRLLSGNRGHYGPLEHPQMTLSCGYFPHSTMQQLRTHRVGVSFDCQSFRYTGNRLIQFINKWTGGGVTPEEIASIPEAIADLEKLVYFRPIDKYKDRKGIEYLYSLTDRNEAITLAIKALEFYKSGIDKGMSPEHARGMIPFDVRQHWVMSFNARSALHLLDLRWKSDAQLECQWFCELFWPHFQNWMPEVAKWYESHRKRRAILAP